MKKKQGEPHLLKKKHPLLLLPAALGLLPWKKLVLLREICELRNAAHMVPRGGMTCYGSVFVVQL